MLLEGVQSGVELDGGDEGEAAGPAAGAGARREVAGDGRLEVLLSFHQRSVPTRVCGREMERSTSKSTPTVTNTYITPSPPFISPSGTKQLCP